MKNHIILILISIFFFSCQNTEQSAEISYSSLGGKTMGTTYSVKYKGTNQKAINKSLDSLFLSINKAVSTYDKESIISQFNQLESDSFKIDSIHSEIVHFVDNFKQSYKIFTQTKGLFDPTVMPLVQFWGFGTEKKKIEDVDDAEIKNLLESVSMNKLKFVIDNNQISINKDNKNTQLDFSAIAKGYAVDKAGELLNANGIDNYLVEIGGEVYCKGKSDNAEYWTIGINSPKEDAAINDFKAYIKISDKGLATSGNYRNFYEVNGKKYVHTINPETGYPELSNLLSATIIADNCMVADAIATACMVGGLEKAIQIVENDNKLFGYFIYSDENGELQTQMTSGFDAYLIK